MAKSADAFRTISEVADWLDVQAHVLRFWESKFNQVKPVKRAGGRRYYRPADMLLLGGIKKLLHEDGMTIKAAQQLLRDEGVAHVAGLSKPLDDMTDDVIEASSSKPKAQKDIAAKKPKPAAPKAEEAPFIDAEEEPQDTAEVVNFADEPVGETVVDTPEPEPSVPAKPAIEMPDLPEMDQSDPPLGVLSTITKRKAKLTQAETESLMPLLAKLQSLRDRMATATR